MRARERELERKVLQLTDQMIQFALSAGLLETVEKEHHLEQAAETVVEMAEAVVEVLQGNDEHLEALIRQVTAQKLPDRRILAGFGDFTQDLDVIIERGLRLFHQRRAGASEAATPASMPDTDDQPLPIVDSDSAPADMLSGVQSADEPQMTGHEQPSCGCGGDSQPSPVAPQTETHRQGLDKEDVVVRNLQKIFPGEQVIRGYLFHGHLLDYYLPGAKTGVQVVGNDGTGRCSARLEYYCAREGVDIRQVKQEEARNPRALTHRLKT